MECVKTKQIKQANVKDFFQEKWPKDTTENTIVEYGYFIKEAESIRAFFMLEPMNQNAVRLKNLYIKGDLTALHVLAIIEMSIQAAREQPATYLYIHSQQETLDELVSQLGFQVVDVPVDNKTIEGQWWGLTVDK
ncbi:hypothetical protein GCM10011351_18450 [Paraliobacillus quinghaiensis]|uniref:Uncharacterized protein n=1 Tax=Paraliobacillus quinghaiensis TaxID=470815 RepID=A0A917TQI4_9BACI|nr:hypothetical protein [Paraliobacillus quinghaiensis]GGM32717.1 hypothetical protein GCM10011351_18450 [Paraliobacillus quinghaiensis]